MPRDDVADSFLDVLIFPKSAALASDDVMAAGDGVVEIGHATLSVEPQGLKIAAGSGTWTSGTRMPEIDGYSRTVAPYLLHSR